jgi:hypothetical protein
MLSQETLASSRGRENHHQRVPIFIGYIAVLSKAFFSGFEKYKLGLRAVVELASYSMDNFYQLKYKATLHIQT